MRQYLQESIPSMYLRRLLLLAVVMVALLVVLLVSSVHLTTGERHEQMLAEARQRLRTAQFIPTRRGAIYDRQGRILARDEPGWDIQVDYAIIGGGWAFDRALADARRERPREWAEMNATQREQLIEHYRVPYDLQIQQLWQTLAALTQTPPERLDRRINQIREAVQLDASYLWHRWRQLRQHELDYEVTLAEVIQPILEERQAHAVIFRVDDGVRLGVQDFLAAAGDNQRLPRDQRDAILEVWQHVELARPRHRQLPLETMTVVVDTASMPSPVRERFNGEPVEVNVQGVGLHMIGLMRRAWVEDMRARPMMRPGAAGIEMDLAGYRDGDEIGQSGVEGAMESVLRGQRGYVIRRRDTDHEQRTDPQAGMDVQLTLDILLQARIQAIMSQDIGLMTVQPWHPGQGAEATQRRTAGRGDALTGAAVVMDVRNSEILAAVSVPEMSWQALRDDPESIYEDPLGLAWVNRPFAKSYLPGSTIKPVILAAAANAGRYRVGEAIFCRGHLEAEHPDRYRCWIFRRYLTGHGPLDAVSAMEQSCNIFFYTLAERMGSRAVVEQLHSFGLGRLPDSGVAGETAGQLPDLARADERGAPGFSRADAIFMGIGQGPVGWSPVQAANAYATLARGGLYISPTLVRPEHRITQQVQHRVALPAAVRREIFKGLEEAVTGARGTTRRYSMLQGERIFNVPGVKMLAKSGTAQAAPLREVATWNEQGLPATWGRVLREGDHGWVIALMQFEGETQPRYVIVVVVEYGGSGSNVAGPIVNQIAHVLKNMHDEGVLD